MTRASSLASSLIGKTVSGGAQYPVMRAAIALFKLVSKANVGSRPDSGSFSRHVSLPAKRLHQIVVENARVEIHPLSGTDPSTVTFIRIEGRSDRSVISGTTTSTARATSASIHRRHRSARAIPRRRQA